jgi:hypothetical protein
LESNLKDGELTYRFQTLRVFYGYKLVKQNFGGIEK